MASLRRSRRSTKPTQKARAAKESQRTRNSAKKSGVRPKLTPSSRVSRSSVAQPTSSGPNPAGSIKDSELDPEKNFLRALYSEIDAATDINDLENDATIGQVTRIARLARFLASLTTNRRQIVIHQLRNCNASDVAVQGALTAVREDLRNSDERKRQRDRLNTTQQLIGVPLLNICAASATFREALRSPEPVYPGLVSWDQVSRLISQNAHSLELFARTRAFPWMRMLPAHNPHYRLLLHRVLWNDLTADLQNSVTDDNFGSPHDESQPLHDLTAPALSPYEWFIPHPVGPALRCEVEYTVSRDLARLPRSGKVEGDHERVHQLDVDEDDASLVLGGYFWPKRLDWPNDNRDPRYCGPGNDPCAVCGTSQDPWISGARRANERACSCTYEDFQDALDVPLIELLELPRCDVSVRALQDIAKDTYLGRYVGEIYPRSRGNQTGGHNARYQGDQGEDYLMVVSVNTRRQKANGDSVPLTTNEYKDYHVDPAVRGNWTRFLNHSCKSNTTFQHVNVGQRLLVLVQARRDISFGDEITVHYGAGYFVDRALACKCAEPTCKLWEAGVPERGPGRQMHTLQQALRTNRSAGLEWIRGDAALSAAVRDGPTRKGKKK